MHINKTSKYAKRITSNKLREMRILHLHKTTLILCINFSMDQLNVYTSNECIKVALK